MSNSTWPRGLQHARPPCPSPTPAAYTKSCPLSRRCHPTISSSVVAFSSCLQSFPASRSFQANQFFTSGGQSIGVSASASALPMNIQYWFPLGLTGWISLQSARLVAINLWFKKKKYKICPQKMGTLPKRNSRKSDAEWLCTKLLLLIFVTNICCR